MNDQLIAVNVLPALNVIQIAVDGDCILLRRDQCTRFLAAFMDAMADSIPDKHSVKAPPELTLVEDGYEANDPKHPTYHGRMSDLWDLRERG